MNEPEAFTTTPPRRTRLAVASAVLLFHLAVIAVLIRAFAPDLPGRIVEAVVSTVTVTVTTPPPEPKSEPAGAAGEAGRKAVPRAVMAPRPRVELSEKDAARAASTGSADTSGARDTGEGTGASGAGLGTGSGTGGEGQGGGTKAVKIKGDITSAKDYPRAGRDLRNGDYVIVAITVGTDGKPSACRVHRPSRDEEANAITCKLAMQRFRFRPATDANGEPVESVYGWKQTWYY